MFQKEQQVRLSGDWERSPAELLSARGTCAETLLIVQDPGKSEAKSGGLDEVSQASGSSVWRPTLFS